MKLILSIVLTAFLAINAFAGSQPKWSNEKLFWKYLEYQLFNDEYLFYFGTYYDDIKIQLTGSYTKADSLFVNNVVQNLKPLLEKVDIYQVHENGNLILNFKTKEDTVLYLDKHPLAIDTIRDFNFKPNKKNFKLFSYLLENGRSYKRSSRDENGISYTNSTMLFWDNTPQSIKNREIENEIITSLIWFRHNKELYNLLNNIPGFSKFREQNNKNIFQEPLNFQSRFTEIDSFMLVQTYSKSFSWNFAKHCTQSYVRYFKDEFWWIFPLIALALLITYFLFLFKWGIFESGSTGYKPFIWKGMLILQSGVIITICYGLYNYGAYYYDKVVPFLYYSALLPYLYAIVSLNVIYVAERFFITNNSLRPLSYLIQFAISFTWIVISVNVFSFIYPLRVNLPYILFSAGYCLFLAMMRAGLNYSNLKLQKAIAGKDLEIISIREMQHKSELQALHSRINPHFLYNSLNSIAGLAKTDPAKTEQMALALSDFCRYTINKQNETYSTVAEEITLVKTYLEIEKTRFGDKLEYTLEIDEACKDFNIPRFLVQPLVENAVKHGISKLTGNGQITVSVSKHNHQLVIAVSDNGPAFPQAPNNGYGLQNIFDRLEILYKGNAHINWQNSPIKQIVIYIPFGI